VLFVSYLGYGIPGVATAALMAEWLAALLGLAIAYADLVRRGAAAPMSQVLDLARMKLTFRVNSDIMIRTVCALIVALFFTAQGARTGDLTLAANAILNTIAMVMIFFLDGFAFAAEALVGRAIGAQRFARFREAVRLSTMWAAGVGVVLSLVIWFAGPLIIDFMTTSPDVRAAAREYLIWAALSPIVGVWCFQLDGIFIGATRTADMRNMMILSAAIFFAAWATLQPAFGNHGLWAAMIVFYVARALTLLGRYPSLSRSAFPLNDAASLRAD
jgi:MATE family multidrug resistance protein